MRMRAKRPHMGSAILALQPNAQFTYIDENYDTLRWDTPDIQKPTKEQVETKLQELLDDYPMKRLREERDRKLAETDWWAGKDVTMSQARKDYRQELRDLPATAEPQLDEQGNLTNVTWPTKPT